MFLVAILLITVPWFFTGAGGSIIAGFPAWAFYSLLATVAYSVLTAYMLKRFWSTMAGDDGEDG